MNRFQKLAAATIAILILWGGYSAYRAHSNLVTLHVRNMEVHLAVRKIEHQTWESILVGKGVGGQVTLNVDKVPLDEVLNIIALQTSTRWTRLYPIYSSRAAASAFDKVVLGEKPAGESHWSNLEKVPIWDNGGAGGFGNTARAANDLVSAQFQNKDLDFAALALSRFSRARVIPEDNANATVNLKLEQAPFETAVAEVARQAHRKWAKLYSIQTTRQIVASVKKADAKEGEEKKITETNKVAAVREERTVPTEREVEAFQATMSPEERKKAQEQLSTVQEIRGLPPAEQQQRMQEIAAQAAQGSQADLEQRIQNRLKNGTTEQRVAHDRQMLQKQQPGQKQ